MPKNALENALVLPILGLLIEQPRHAYALLRELRHRYDYLNARNATVYTLLSSLTEAGWVETSGERERAVLAATEAGVAALAGRVEEQLRTADLTGGPAFVAALAYLGVLPPARAAEVLGERVERIRAEREGLERAIGEAGQHELHMIEVHYLSARLAHDIDWLTGLGGRIERGELPWPR